MIELMKIIRQSTETAIMNSNNYSNYKMKSSEFIKCLHTNFEEYYKNNTDIVIFSKEKPNDEFSRNEYLFDILVAEKGYTFSKVHKKKIPYIKKALIELESEFEQNVKASIIDFSKLICGHADYKIMILPFTNNHNNYLDPLAEIAVNDVDKNIAAVFIDHPSNWQNSDDLRFKTFKFNNNRFEALNIG